MSEEKMSLQEKLESRSIDPVPALPYRFMTKVSKILFYKKYGVNFTYNVDLTPYRNTPYVLIANHASRLDYEFTGLPFYPDTFNYVMGYNELFRSHLAFLLRRMHIIPKKNFVPHNYPIRQIIRVIKKGGRIIIMPEGMSSISGHSQPCAVGSGKLIKKLGVPVFYNEISGGYLTSTKYDLKDRPGHVDVSVNLLFTPEDLKRMTADEIQEKMDRVLWHDDYEWNKKAHYAFAGKGSMARNLHQLLFWCPKCGRMLEMDGSGDVLKCTHCGNGVSIDEYYDLHPLDDSCIYPETPSVWFDLERKEVRKMVEQEGFKLEEQVRLGILPKYEYLKDQKTSEIVGSGRLTLNREGLHYSGTREGRPWAFDVEAKQLPTYGMCTDVSRFYTFVEGEFIEFYPERDSAMLWMMATEENHRLVGGSWKDYPADHPANTRPLRIIKASDDKA